MRYPFLSLCRPMLRSGSFIALSLLAPAAQAVQIMGNSAPYLSVGAGVFNLVGAVNTYGYNHSPAEINVEYQTGDKLYGIGFAWGLLANSDGGVDGYGGLYSNIALTPHWILTPLAALSGYRQGSSKDLGSTFLFRLELGLAYQLDNGSRVGLKMAHLSNGDLYARNPGENEVLLTYAFPLD